MLPFQKITYFLVGLILFAPLSSDCEAAFVDVAPINEYYDAINFVQKEAIVQGYEDGSYRPDVTINRAELVKIIVGSTINMQAANDCLPVGVLPFSDVPSDAWFTPYVCAAFTAGIIEGYEDGTFRPAATVNFAEAAKIITTGFSFNPEPTEIWYESYVRTLEEEQAIPLSISRFDKDLSRGEMAEIIYRLLADVQKLSQTYEGLLETTSNQQESIESKKLLTSPVMSVSERCELTQNVTQKSTYFYVSPNGEQVLSAGCENDEKKFVYAHGILHSNLDEVLPPVFSATGKRMAFFIKKDGVWTLFLDGELHQIEGSIQRDNFIFSPNETFYMYVSGDPNTLYKETTPLPHEPYGLPVFSDDGERVAYRAILGDKMAIVLNGQKQESYKVVSAPTFAPNGDLLAYFALNYNVAEPKDPTDFSCIVHVAGKISPYNCNDMTMVMQMGFGKFPPIVFSKDGTQVAYPVLDSPGIVGDNGFDLVEYPKYAMAINGQVIDESYQGLFGKLAFNPVSNHLAYVVGYKMGDGSTRSYVVYDGQKQKEYKTIDSAITFSDNGSKLQYIATTISSDFRLERQVLVTNGVESSPYADANDLIISPDTKRLAYTVNLPEKSVQNDPNFGPVQVQTVHERVVLDGVEQPYIGNSLITSGVFSPNSKHFAYIVTGIKNLLVLDDMVIEEEYDELLTDPIFSTDSSLIMFAVRIKNDIWWIVKEVAN